MFTADERPLRSIVTGGSGALGSAVIQALKARGDRVLCLDLVAPENDCDEFIYMNAADRASVDAAMAEVDNRFGGIDILINCVGILKTAKFIDISEADFVEHQDINLIGAFRIGQAVSRRMLAQGGRIVFVTSVHGQVGVPQRGAYAASKGGVAAMARVMAAELAEYRIRVNVLAPGPIDGGMPANSSTRAGWIDATPIHRVATLNEVANVASLLTADTTSFVNGQILAIDGGASSLRIF